MLDAGEKLTARRRDLPWLLRIEQNRPVILVQEAEMDVGAAAGTVRVVYRREAHALSEAPSDRMGELARDDGVVGGADSLRRRNRDLVLLRAELGEKGVRYDPHLAHGGEQTLAEGPLAPIGAEIVGLPLLPCAAAT